MREKACPVCKEIKPLTSDYYGRNKSKSSGYDSQCKQCKYKRAYANKKIRGYQKEYRKSVMTPKRTTEKNKYKRDGCCICGYNKCLGAIDYHHIDETSKTKAVSRFNSSIESMQREISKCIAVCSNCHREIHSGMIPSEVYRDKVIIIDS